MIKRSLSVLPALALSITTSQADHSFSLPSYNGGGNVSFPTGQVTIVDFWASWCAPCKQSFPYYNGLLSKFPGLKIIGINEDKEKGAADKFLASTPASFTLAADPGGRVYSQYDVGNMPTAYLFDKSGKLVRTFPGFHGGNEMDSAIKELMK